LSNGESRFISRTAWDKDQNRRSQEIFSRNQQAEATSYLQNVSQAKLNDLRINFNQQAYHSVFGNNAQDNKVIVGLPSGDYGLSKAELDQEQARRNVIETERQNKLAAQRALQAQKEQAVGIETERCALIPMKDNQLGFIARRFDRGDNNEEYHQEDFCQILEQAPHQKYTGSYEQVAKVLKLYSHSPGNDRYRLFELILFNFIVGNVDHHLKNITLSQSSKNLNIRNLSKENP
jgi:serine/threonine protein kinase HipA of HipAB toxin-antitoxin module